MCVRLPRRLAHAHGAIHAAELSKFVLFMKRKYLALHRAPTAALVSLGDARHRRPPSMQALTDRRRWP